MPAAMAAMAARTAVARVAILKKDTGWVLSRRADGFDSSVGWRFDAPSSAHRSTWSTQADENGHMSNRRSAVVVTQLNSASSSQAHASTTAAPGQTARARTEVPRASSLLLSLRSSPTRAQASEASSARSSRRDRDWDYGTRGSPVPPRNARGIVSRYPCPSTTNVT